MHRSGRRHYAAMRRDLLALIIAVFLLAGCGGEGQSPAAPPAGPSPAKNPMKSRAYAVSVEPVHSADVAAAIRAPATVAPAERISIVAKVAGVIDNLAIREGTAVTPEQILVVIDVARYRLKVDIAAAAVAIAAADLDQANAALDRRQRLRELSPVSAEELSQWEAKQRAAEAVLAQRKAEQALAQLDCDHAEVHSPIAGIIEARLVDPGVQVAIGDPIARLLQIEPLRLHFSIPVADAARISTGTAVSTAAPAPAGAVATGSVVFIAGEADPTTRRVAIIAELQPGSGLHPGAFVEAVLTVSTGHVPVIPVTAVRTGTDGFTVYVVIDGKAERRSVETGLRTVDGRIEIRSGLAEGETLVIRGAEALTPGVEVRVVAPASAE